MTQTFADSKKTDRKCASTFAEEDVTKLSSPVVKSFFLPAGSRAAAERGADTAVRRGILLAK